MSEENYLKMDEWNIYYSIIGNGPHIVLFNIGTLAHSRTDMIHQIEGFDLEKFTIVAWDPPGYGKSRPLEREVTKDVFSENADYAFRLMKALNFDRYSVWGACSGGTAAMILAARHPEVIRALILSNTRSHLLTSDVEKMLQLREVVSWKTKALEVRVNMYGKELLNKMWTKWVEILQKIYEENQGNLCSEVLGDIKCPTFILGGGRDPFLDHSHAYYLQEHIRGSKLHVDPEGTHSYHLAKPAEFNRIVQDFLLEH